MVLGMITPKNVRDHAPDLGDIWKIPTKRATCARCKAVPAALRPRQQPMPLFSCCYRLKRRGGESGWLGGGDASPALLLTRATAGTLGRCREPKSRLPSPPRSC